LAGAVIGDICLQPGLRFDVMGIDLLLRPAGGLVAMLVDRKFPDRRGRLGTGAGSRGAALRRFAGSLGHARFLTIDGEPGRAVLGPLYDQRAGYIHQKISLITLCSRYRTNKTMAIFIAALNTSPSIAALD